MRINACHSFLWVNASLFVPEQCVRINLCAYMSVIVMCMYLHMSVSVVLSCTNAMTNVCVFLPMCVEAE